LSNWAWSISQMHELHRAADRNRPICRRVARSRPDGKENVMHRFIFALVLVAATAACEYKNERTVQNPAPATVTTSTPASSTYVTPTGNTTTVTSPAPAASTTVYTR
jgi:hypothetical protein